MTVCLDFYTWNFIKNIKTKTIVTMICLLKTYTASIKCYNMQFLGHIINVFLSYYIFSIVKIFCSPRLTKYKLLKSNITQNEHSFKILNILTLLNLNS